ncbi:MAG: hypothetical protein EZS28_017848 [Streblomastix strix]|uniref:Uncharacterized protein n=1 Tax=Streblomastix strix TaxID=222440 RepID=A0A5J4VVC4_9EUKA|nr:MAG: hypothetical protein EZS28_017848 [Streblomastix strix]
MSSRKFINGGVNYLADAPGEEYLDDDRGVEEFDTSCQLEKLEVMSDDREDSDGVECARQEDPDDEICTSSWITLIFQSEIGVDTYQFYMEFECQCEVLPP